MSLLHSLRAGRRPLACRLRLHRWQTVGQFNVRLFPLGRYKGARGVFARAFVFRCNRCLLSRTEHAELILTTDQETYLDELTKEESQ